MCLFRVSLPEALLVDLTLWCQTAMISFIGISFSFQDNWNEKKSLGAQLSCNGN